MVPLNERQRSIIGPAIDRMVEAQQLVNDLVRMAWPTEDSESYNFDMARLAFIRREVTCETPESE